MKRVAFAETHIAAYNGGRNRDTNPMMDQDWFEMTDIRRRKLNTAVWIPLHAAHKESVGEYGTLGYREEFFGGGSLAVPLDKKAGAETLGWGEFGLMQGDSGGMEGGRYVPADVFDGYGLGLSAVALVLVQEGNTEDGTQWHLHQDFAITLKLKREGDAWVAMEEGYIEVARLKRDAESRPMLLEVRAEHLKDYLCARGMALYISSYRNREEVVSDASHINWADDLVRLDAATDRWEGRRIETIEGGRAFGSSTRVVHIGRKGIDVKEDVPGISPSDQNITSESWTIEHKGEKLIQIQGELWRNEWIDPADMSPRVRRDKLPSSVFFVTDAKGTRCGADRLEGAGGWLWFRPEVIMALLNWRGGALRWYTRHTGGVRSSPGSYLHFGVNELGRVNVYAKDIVYLFEWEQQIWAGFNVGPEGGVSEELLAAQAAGQPANTQAPEEYLPKAFDLLNETTAAKSGFRLFREHADVESLLARAHRFRATDQAGVFALAKDLARLTADRIDAAAIQKIVPPSKGEKWASLKSLEKLLAHKIGPERAHDNLTPLFGIYELRHADAHLASSDIDEAFSMAGVDRAEPFVFQGYRLLNSCVSSLWEVLEVLRELPSKTA